MNVLQDFSNGLILNVNAPRFLELSDPADEGAVAVQDFLNWLTLKMKALQQSDTSCTVQL